ncbi:TMEM175 family protein [Verrucomicrobiota bacterium sgz303538]
MDEHLRETDRLEFFSDGVFAIAATLLCVDLKVPPAESLAGITLLEALAHKWPSFVAFAASFIFIGIAWAAHHDMFNFIRRTNHCLLMINLIFLMSIALQPFSTALMAEHFGKPNEHTAALIYYGVLSVAGISYNALWTYANHANLVGKRLDPKLLRALNLEHATVPVLHIAALIIAYWSVPWSFVPIVLSYGFFALPRVTERYYRKHGSLAVSSAK